ncbi:MAG: response regulator [Candidatus Aminicenantes bacterium]|nr:response regulator [Candidatus Aminicenantes bacterium]NIM84353.1 response regulator [Candidatus Aminicenantes bacterium]NIN23839.1 response regulator [Candidatus Aminicenantes bacterium]NIN47555.1 response regulator [Candidatus Aminicenantes bacterium]NIN90475.1 response regulator [Candidatus Aminicenantes bacterium]
MKDISRILVIDDEESMRDSCNQVLSKDGHRVDTAENGMVGLEKIKTFKPDLVLVDLKMPGISGMEVLEKVNVIDPTIVAVVITGYANLESAIHAFKRGAYDFLPKPFTPDELRIIIKRGLERRKLILKSIALEQEKESMRKFFITMVSHQLCSPLATVQQNLEIILDGIVGDVPEKQEKLLRRARESISSLLTLIKDWLDLSKIETGKLVETFESLSLVPLLQETIESLRPLAQERNITLTLHRDDGDIPMINGDLQSLQQLFTNLISNAIKFNHQGGQVNITLQERDSYLEIKISDTGIGIAENDLPFIFDEFHRVRGDETQTVPGTGLGLSIARKIAEAHSASITVESRVGEGSMFTVHFPRD